MPIFSFAEWRPYFFSAQRLNVPDAPVNAETILAYDARNLATVIHHLSSHDSSMFNRFNELVRMIFDDVKHVNAPINPDQNPPTAGLRIWPVEEKTRRSDLAQPLNECGTGIGQVLAILYVVVTSENPRTIVIDEPNSFLHPGAVRRLFDILRFEYSHHQYIVTTHSTSIISMAAPKDVIRVRKIGSECIAEQFDLNELTQLKEVMNDLGIRLADVYGADRVLWVEGPTEEICFPLIWSALAKRSLIGTSFVAVRNTGDFDKAKNAKNAVQIYQRLSQGKWILPPAIGFIFDREKKTQQQIEDINRHGNDRIRFLSRMMYENYLLNSSALADVISKNCRPSNPVSVEDINDWIDDKWCNQEFLPKSQHEQDKQQWFKKIHGADFLKSLFREFGGDGYEYNKIEHGELLTRWIIQNSPSDFEEISNLLSEFKVT